MSQFSQFYSQETWDSGESKITETVTTKLGVPIEKSDIERANCVGKKRSPVERPDNRTTTTGGRNEEPQLQQRESADRESKPRPIVCKFGSWKKREAVLQAAKEEARNRPRHRDTERNEAGFRPNKFSDFSQEVRNTRRKLLEHLRELKSRSGNEYKRGYLRYNKLVFNNTTYMLNEHDELIAMER